MMYEPSKLDLAQMIGEEVSRLRRERDQLKEINDRMAEDRLRLVDELEGWKDNAEDTLRMYDKLKAERDELASKLDTRAVIEQAIGELTDERNALQVQLDKARALHQPECRYTPDDGETSCATLVEAVDVATGAPITFFEVCSHCASIEMAEGCEHDYKESLWPCQDAKALGLVGEAGQ